MVSLVVDEKSYSSAALECTLDSVHRQTHNNWSLVLVFDDMDQGRVTDAATILARPWYANALALHPGQVLSEAQSRQAASVLVTRVGTQLIDSTLERCIFLAGWRKASFLAMPIWRTWNDAHDPYFQAPTVEPLLSDSLADDIDTAIVRSKFELTTFRRLDQSRPSQGVMVHDYLVQEMPPWPDSSAASRELGKPPEPRVHRCPLSEDGDVWLFAERAGTATDDNAWAMFKWMCRNQPSVQSYFVLNPHVNYDGPAEFAERIVRKGTLKWSSLLARCKVALFNDSARDLLYDWHDFKNYPEIYWVYLTHGALGALPGVYQAGHPYFDLVCTESSHASNQAAEVWGHSRGIFAATGLARWDDLQDTPDDGDLLFIPTWRKSLDDAEADALSSELMQFATQFLGSQRLRNLLLRTNRKLRVSMHFRAEHLLNELATYASEHIEIIDPADATTSVSHELASCGAVISDYSSVSWDVLVQGKATFLCQFDKLSWIRERGYRHLLAPHAAALFELSYGVDELLDQLEERVLADKVVSADLPNHVRERYLPFPGGSNCQAIFNQIVTRFRDRSVPTAARSFTEAYDLSSLGNSAFDPSAIFIGSDRLLACLSSQVTPTDMNEVKEHLRAGSTQIILQPCLDGESVWADQLFSIEGTRDLIRALAEEATAYGAQLTVATMPDYPFRSELGALTDQTMLEVQLKEPRPLGPPSSVDISVIVPCFNSAARLERCVRSVMNQRFHGTVEVILVDDGSTDFTSLIVQKLQAEFDNVLSIGKPNGRQGSARNLGLLTCRGATVTFLDSDDELAEHALETLYAGLEDSAADICTGFHVSINKTGTTHHLNQSHLHYLAAPRRISSGSWAGLHIDPSAVAKLYRTDFLLENSIFFSHSYYEDEFFRSLTDLKGAVYENSRQAVYRNHAKQGATGTTCFDTTKFAQIVRVGLLLTELFDRSSSLDSRRTKIMHLLRRYVRFWNKSQGGEEVVTAEVRALLTRFVRSLPQDWCQSVAGAGEMAAALGLEIESANGAVDCGETALNNLVPYNYYEPKILWAQEPAQDIAERKETAADVRDSTSYKLGSMVIQALAQPGIQTLKLPLDLSALAIRKLTKGERAGNIRTSLKESFSKSK